MRFVICTILLLLSGFGFAQTNITINGTKVNFGSTELSDVDLDKHWRFKIGDNPEWAKRDFDDSKWDTVYMPLTIAEFVDFNYKGNLWIRSTFFVHKNQLSQKYVLLIKQYGASEIYIDGKLIHQLGTVSNTAATETHFNPHNRPLILTIDSIGKHSIAVRFSNHAFAGTDDEAYLNAFDLTISNEQMATVAGKISSIKGNVLYSVGIGLFFALGIMNFILFVFYKRDKTNLFYSLFCTAVCLTFLLQVISFNSESASTAVLIDRLNMLFTFVSNFFLLSLVYSFIYQKMPKRLWVVLAASIVGCVLIIPEFEIAEMINNVVGLYSIIDIIVIVLGAYFKRYDPTKKKRKRIMFVFAALGVIACLGLFIHKAISIIIFVLLVLVIILPVAGLIFIVPVYMTIRHARSFAVTNKSLEEQLEHVKELSAKTLEQEQEKKKILEEQNEKLEELVQERTSELAEKNLEITDSINYARRIQRAILTTREEINATLKKSFILFKPKDIVSGDFYFYEKKDNVVVIAAADCTGHGVPGALMSMIGSEKLMGAVSESTDPSRVLNLLNRGIKSSLRQSDSDESTRDGMDIALVSIDLITRVIQYAGANRPIWIIRKGSTDVEEIKATKKAIGGLTPDDQVFDQHQVQFDPGDTFYLFSDGYADQFGSNGKKLMTKKFREILMSIQSLSMEQQEKHLDEFIEGWKKDVEQVDDILVIGVQL